MAAITQHTSIDQKVEEPIHNETQFNVADAIAAEHVERSMTLWEGLKAYPKAIGWSIAISFCIIMEGYDTSLLGSVVGIAAFRERYGHYSGNPKTGYQLDTAWQTAVTQSATIGAFLGIFVASWAQQKFGYRHTIRVCLVLVTGFIFIVFFAPNIQVLFVGEFLCGFPWGCFASAAVAYASEVTPVALRGYLTTYVNLCWIMGQFIGAGVLKACAQRTDHWAYKIPFAIQWLWPVPLFIAVTLAPESPWFLVRKGRLEEAERSIRRLASRSENVDPVQVIAYMQRTNQHEIDNKIGTSYIDCFKGVEWRRTEIACFIWATTVLSGSSFANHPVYYFEQAGLSSNNAFSLNIGLRGLAFLGTLLSWISMTYFGRRPIILTGLCGTALCLLLVGVLAFPAEKHSGAAWGAAGLVMVWVFIWDFCINPIAYTVVGEVSSTRLRGKTVGLARNLYNVSAVVCGILNTYQQNPTAWGWGSKAGFFWFGTCVLALTWAFFRLPECKGRTFRELDILFERRLPARKFKDTVIAEEEDH